MDASQVFTLHFSHDVAGSNATASFIFFSIYDETAPMAVFNDILLHPSTASALLPANTLTSGHLYDYELDYSNRDILSNPGGADFGPQLGFDTRTDGLFATAARNWAAQRCSRSPDWRVSSF